MEVYVTINKKPPSVLSQKQFFHCMWYVQGNLVLKFYEIKNLALVKMIKKSKGFTNYSLRLLFDDITLNSSLTNL